MASPTTVVRATSNAEFVEAMCSAGHIKHKRVKEAFLKVDRKHHAPEDAYINFPAALGFWALISRPELDASALETTIDYLLPTARYPRRRVLDVGSGSGYTTHLLAEMVGSDGIVIGIEHYYQLRDIAERNLKKSARGVELLNTGKVAFVTGDGREGLTSHQRHEIAGIDDDTKWDVIYVGASAKWVVPPELLRQLRAPGCMFIPIMQVKNSKLFHVVWKIEKDELGYETRTVIHEDSDSDCLQHLSSDPEDIMNQPGYGVIPKVHAKPRDHEA